MPLADRRLASRFDIVGNPWGTLDALEPLRVRDLAPGGMLVESPTPLAVGSVHEFELIDGTISARVRATVRHLASPPQAGGARRFLVGLEFLDLDAQSSAGVGRIINEQSMHAYSRGA
jgi:hypothetical protein